MDYTYRDAKYVQAAAVLRIERELYFQLALAYAPSAETTEQWDRYVAALAEVRAQENRIWYEQAHGKAA